MSPTALELHFPEEIRQFAADLIHTKRFHRLRGVSFLGAIERFGGRTTADTNRTAGSRYDHSIGVADQIVALGALIKLSPGEFRLALTHALLHDIGHGPFSHSCENFFLTKFDIDHHRVLQTIIEDEHSDESKILRQYGVWFDYRHFLRSPTRFPIIDALFHGPINVDTIEGILRAARFFDIPTDIDEKNILQSIGRGNVALRPLDRFWHLKSCVYNDYIFDREQAKCDKLICDALFSIADEVKLSDFYLNDESFEERYHQALQRQLALSRVTFEKNKLRRRAFSIDNTAAPRHIKGLGTRYTEIRGGNARYFASN